MTTHPEQPRWTPDVEGVLERAERRPNLSEGEIAWPSPREDADLIRDLASSLRAALARAEKAEGERERIEKDHHRLQVLVEHLSRHTEQLRVLREALGKIEEGPWYSADECRRFARSALAPSDSDEGKA